MEKSYTNAYCEVLEVLKYIPKEDYDKVPTKMIQLMEANYDQTNQFTYNVAIPFDKQEISEEAKLILAVLYRNCWITEEEKRNLKEKEIKDLREKQEKYNPDKLFIKETEKIEQELEEHNELVVQEKKWYQKLLNSIHKFFNKQ